jgi:hypothetical protein
MKYFKVGFSLCLFLILLLSFGINCKSQQYNISKPDTQWKNDSLGCNGARTNQYRKIFYDRSKYYGIKYEDVIRIFGEPNNSTNGNRNIIYILAIGGDQCDSLKKYCTIKTVYSRDIFIEAMLEFKFDEHGKLVDIIYEVV